MAERRDRDKAMSRKIWVRVAQFLSDNPEFSQNEMERRLGMEKGSLSRAISDQRVVTAAMAAELAKIVDLSLREMMLEDPEEPASGKTRKDKKP